MIFSVWGRIFACFRFLFPQQENSRALSWELFACEMKRAASKREERRWNPSLPKISLRVINFTFLSLPMKFIHFPVKPGCFWEKFSRALVVELQFHGIISLQKLKELWKVIHGHLMFFSSLIVVHFALCRFRLRLLLATQRWQSVVIYCIFFLLMYFLNKQPTVKWASSGCDVVRLWDFNWKCF